MFIAIVTFFGAIKGGRLNPPQTGFRPQIDIRGVHTSCIVESLDNELFSFDKEHRVSLKLMFPEHFQDVLNVGEAVNFYEGNKLIGSGKIVTSERA